jgi:hypothetical protein
VLPDAVAGRAATVPAMGTTTSLLAAAALLAAAPAASADAVASVKGGDVWLPATDGGRPFQVTAAGGDSSASRCAPPSPSLRSPPPRAPARPSRPRPRRPGPAGLHTGTTAPLTIPGTGVQQGEALPKGARLVFRTVTVEGDQQPRFTLRAPRGLRLRGLAPAPGVGFAVVDRGTYAGRTSVRVRAYAASKDAEERTARIYALAR